jgi:predicted transcriptional regulator
MHSHPEIPLPLVMRRPLIALHLYDTVSDALDTAREHGVHHFPVCNHEQVVGMVCTCDLQEAKLEQAVGNLMHPAVTIPSNSSTAEAAMLMKAADVGSVLVTDGRGSPCGIVTRSDLSGDPPVAALLEDCRCEACGSIRHLHRHGERWLCFACHERATEPQAFDTGGGD